MHRSAEYFWASCGVWGTGNHFEPALRFGKIENQQSLWQGKTLKRIAYAPMHLVMECFIFLCARHAWLEQPQIWVCSQVSAARGMRIHPCCVILIYSSLNSGCVLPYYDVNGPRRCFSLSLIIMALVVLVPYLFRESLHYILNVCTASRGVPTSEPTANPIKWKTCWYTGCWANVSKNTGLVLPLICR